MLLQRILTAIPLAALASWLIFFQSSEVLFYAFLVVTFIAGWEWSRLSGMAQPMLRGLYALVITLSTWALDTLNLTNPLVIKIVLGLSVVWWIYVLYRMSTRSPAAASDQLAPFKVVIGFVTLIPAVLALKHIHAQADGSVWLFYIISIIWVADIGAYFTGKRFGRTKLAPLVSPGKTREGLYGAVLATSLYSIAAAVYFELQIIQTVMLLIIAFFATLLSVIGDLFISVLKRERGVKDSGSILPGHGGVLDRIDSITSSAPFFVVLLDWLVLHVGL